MKPPSLDELRTPRLLLTRIRESDLADLCRMYSDERVMATLGGVRSEQQTKELLERHLVHWAEHRFGVWVAREPATRIAEEAAAISAAIPENSVLVTLDERGDNIDSSDFAQKLGQWRDRGTAHTIFAIGGADGLSPELQGKAGLRIAFGTATWPHQMVRVMLLEQLYRAATILAGHPYHRA